MIQIILALLAGLSMGYSIGIGFYPIHNLPKNTKKLLTVAFFGLSFLFLFFLLTFV